RRVQLDAIGKEAEASSTFENAPDVVRKYESYKRFLSGTRWEVEPHRKLKEYRDRAELHAKPEFEELLADEPPLIEQRRWRDLLALYGKFPRKFLDTTDSGAALLKKRREVTQRLIEAYAKEKA